MTDDSETLADTETVTDTVANTVANTTIHSKEHTRPRTTGQSVNNLTDSRSHEESLQPPADEMPSHVVGIGASAGGLPALQAIFEGIPGDTGAAFVVVQHLSPKFNTLMDELLARHSTMTVKLADDGEYLQRNQIYVCLLYTSDAADE